MSNPWAYAYNALKYIGNVNANIGKAVTQAAPAIAASQAAAPTVASTPTSSVPTGASATQAAQNAVLAQNTQINDAQDNNMRKAALAAQGGMMSTMFGGGRGFGIGRGMTSAITLGGGNYGLGS